VDTDGATLWLAMADIGGDRLCGNGANWMR
jgi:hypothetical protein